MFWASSGLASGPVATLCRAAQAGEWPSCVSSLRRMSSFNTGISLDNAVDVFDFTKAFIQLLLRARNQVPQARQVPVPSSTPVVRCFCFDRSGVYRLGAAWPYSLPATPFASSAALLVLQLASVLLASRLLHALLRHGAGMLDSAGC